MAPDRLTSVAVWHGSTEDLQRLSLAVEHNCSCVTGMFGRVSEVCAAHRMLVNQRVLDHLLFVRRTTDAFTRAEWRDDASALDDAAVPEQDVTNDEPSGHEHVTWGADQELARRPSGD